MKYNKSSFQFIDGYLNRRIIKFKLILSSCNFISEKRIVIIYNGKRLLLHLHDKLSSYVMYHIVYIVIALLLNVNKLHMNKLQVIHECILL